MLIAKFIITVFFFFITTETTVTTVTNVATVSIITTIIVKYLISILFSRKKDIFHKGLRPTNRQTNWETGFIELLRPPKKERKLNFRHLGTFEICEVFEHF